MFDEIRTPGQAFGFYIILTIVGLILGAISGGFSSSVEQAYVTGTIVSGIYCPLMAFLVLSAKNRLNEAGLIILFLASGILGYFLGMFIGLIPAAYLTTLEKK